MYASHVLANQPKRAGNTEVKFSSLIGMCTAAAHQRVSGKLLLNANVADAASIPRNPTQFSLMHLLTDDTSL